ncbi:Aromatic-amino-acid aminotransferase 1 (ARAT-I) (AROAT) [Durusdinium trenchii]|uniref:Aromatic-amino-acid aminotransferase 1 (ARAT-I) (AROAT) n=1 Tax=Durusdinium trenchii TaxID=1381693 RepID=A0ABP0PIF4_9DINO
MTIIHQGFSQRAGWAGDQPISYLMHKALANPELISLAAGFVDQDTLPVDLMRQAVDSLLSDRKRGQAALQYGTTVGHAPLREIALNRWREADGEPECERGIGLDQVLITAGSNELLHLLGDTLCDPGDIILVASPCYFVYLGLATNLGIRTIGVEADEQGMIPESLEDTLRQLNNIGDLPRVKAIYLTDYFNNPSTESLALERRGPIVETAKRWSRSFPIRVIEDAAYRELRYKVDDIPSLRSFDEEGDTVVVAQTFSKSFSPGIRVGFGILPPDLVAPCGAQKGNIDFGAPNFTQCVLAEVFNLGLFEEHLGNLRRGYEAKLNAMVEACDEHLAPLDGVSFTRPGGGLYVWLTLPHEVNTSAASPLFERAMDEGMIYVPGEYCYAVEGAPIAHNQIRLSFGVQSQKRIREGIAALARAVFFICFCSLTGLYIIFDAFANLDEFMQHAGDNGNLLGIMGEYYAYRSIYFFDKTSGLLALVSAMFTVTWIRRHNELTALMAAGVSRGRVVVPVILAAICISLFAAGMRETVLPRIQHELSRDPKNLSGEKGQVFRARYDNETVILIGGKASYRSDKRIESPQFNMPPALATYGNQIVATNAYFRPADPATGRPAGYLIHGVERPKDLYSEPSLFLEGRPVVITPADHPEWLQPDQCFIASNMDFEQLTGGTAWRQFSSTAELMRGLRNPSLDFGADVRVAIHSRLVQPLLDVTLLFLGLPMVLRRDTGNMFLAMGLCLAAVSVFMMVVIACQYLGAIMFVGTATAAWLPLMIFIPIVAFFSDPLRQ